ncbi:MAG: hypothetical protein IJZ94_00075 [Clostridia bacterium]|nr:hypothetical protein [Clostridia bacterium]
MIGLFSEKIYKKLLVAVFAILFLCSAVFLVIPQNVSAAVSPELSIQIGSVYSETATLDSGAQGTALVFLDCGDFIFKSGSVKINMDASLFADVTAKSDTEVITKTDIGEDVISVKYSFDSTEGFHGTVQLGTITFKVKETAVAAVDTDIKISEVKFIDSNASTHTDDFSIKNVVLTVINEKISGNVNQNSAVPSATSTQQVSTENPQSTPANNSTQVSAAPAVTDSTELLTDTAMYTLEDVEDLSNGAIVFWGIVFLIIGIWIGIALGYWFWCKKKSKPQVKDTHGNVIGHLK